jgi:hypothetical protein
VWGKFAHTKLLNELYSAIFLQILINESIKNLLIKKYLKETPILISLLKNYLPLKRNNYGSYNSLFFVEEGMHDCTNHTSLCVSIVMTYVQSILQNRLGVIRVSVIGRVDVHVFVSISSHYIVVKYFDIAISIVT